MKNIRCACPTTILAQPLAEKWKEARLFGNASWVQKDIDFELIEGEHDQVGAVRLISGPAGDVKEKLVEHNDQKHFYRYTIVESPFPIRNYEGKIQLSHGNSPDSCQLNWEVNFDAAKEMEGAMSGAVSGMLAMYAQGAQQISQKDSNGEGSITSNGLNARATAVLNYWFKSIDSPEANYELWYGGTPAIDADITSLFAGDLAQAETGVLDSWMEQGPLSALALIIIKDQFALNIYRDRPEGYESSARTVSNSYTAIAKGYDLQVNETMRSFFYLPLMHSEKLIDQEKCVELYNVNFSDPGASEFAVIHRDIVKKYGRFPGRNKVMGRQSTYEEEEYLKNGGVF